MSVPGEIADVVEHWERTIPDRVAVRFGERSWTWSQWGDRIRRAAAAQLAAGLRPGDRVASLDKNHPASLELTFACAMVGTVHAVINFRLAPDEVAYAINDSHATVVFVGAEFLPVLEGVRDRLRTVRQVVVVGGANDRDDQYDQYEAWLAAAEPLRVGHPHDGGDCFLQLYTSGTTGFPKGAMLTHRGLTAHSVACAIDAGLDLDSVAMVAMPLFHAGGSSFALAALIVGARIVVMREANPPALLDAVVAERITHSFFVPALLAFLLKVPDVAERDYATLRLIVYGASPMPLPLLRRCLEVFPVDFHQVYGLTEVSGVLTVLGAAEHRDPANQHRLLSAGKPIGDVSIRIVDPVTGRRLPAGEVGEIWARTAQAMSGYWNRPADSAEMLRPDGWLRTGDVGHLDEDGYLYISDRVRDMIISGGENVYPVEIERVIAEHPSVADVAVIGVPDDTWGEVPKALVVAAANQTVDPDALIAFCRTRLAAFKCPKSVDEVDALPRNLTGKVLKKELRTPFWAGRERAI